MMDGAFPAGMVQEIRQYLAQDIDPQGQDLYPRLFHTATFFPLQRQEELRAMIRIAQSRHPKVVAEIGCDKGGGLYHWAKSLPELKTLIGFEIRGTPYAELFAGAFPWIEFVWGTDSQDHLMIQHLYKSLEWPIDILFIDGDKTKMVQDFDLWLQLMHPNGIVFIHDVTDREPEKAFQTIARRGYKNVTLIDRTDTARAFHRMDQGHAPANAHEAWLRHWGGRSCGVGVIELGG